MVPFIKTGYCLTVPDWESILNNFHFSVLNDDLIKHSCSSWFASHKAHIIPEVKKVLQELKLSVAHLYINLTAGEVGFGRHFDEDDVFFWQVQGSTEWNVDNFGKHILKKGDLIFVPKHCYHEVKSLEPRAGISMSA